MEGINPSGDAVNPYQTSRTQSDSAIGAAEFKNDVDFNIYYILFHTSRREEKKSKNFSASYSFGTPRMISITKIIGIIYH